MRGWPTAVVTACLSVALAVCTLVKLIHDNEFQTIWAWVGLALALGVMLTALIRVRFRWETRHRTRGLGRATSCRLRRGAGGGLHNGYPVRTTYGGDQVSTWSVLRSRAASRGRRSAS